MKKYKADFENSSTKLRAEAHIDELAEVSVRGKKDSPDYKKHSFAKDGFNYRTAYFLDEDGEYYKLTISVGKNGEVNTIYNVGKIKEADFPLSGSKAGRINAEESVSANMITQNEAIVKYSTKDDSDGRTQLQIALEKAGIDSSIFENGGNDAQLSIENGKGIKSGAFYVDKNIIAIDWRSEPAQITEAVTLHEMTHSAESSKYFGAYKEFLKAQLGEDFEKQTREIADTCCN